MTDNVKKQILGRHKGSEITAVHQVGKVEIVLLQDKKTKQPLEGCVYFVQGNSFKAYDPLKAAIMLRKANADPKILYSKGDKQAPELKHSGCSDKKQTSRTAKKPKRWGFITGKPSDKKKMK